MSAPTDRDGAPVPARTARRYTAWVSVGIGAVALVTAAWLSLGTAQPTAGPPAATPTPAASVPAPAEGAEPTPDDEPAPTSPSDSEAPDLGAGPGLQNRLPSVAEPTPLVASPLPESARALNVLVEGFPSAVMGPLAASDIISSSIAKEGVRMQVTLVARTDASPDEVRDHYRAVWSGCGLTPVGSEPEALVAAADTFTAVTLGFEPDGGTGTVYTVSGVFRGE